MFTYGDLLNTISDSNQGTLYSLAPNTGTPQGIIEEISGREPLGARFMYRNHTYWPIWKSHATGLTLLFTELGDMFPREHATGAEVDAMMGDASLNRALLRYVKALGHSEYLLGDWSPSLPDSQSNVSISLPSYFTMDTPLDPVTSAMLSAALGINDLVSGLNTVVIENMKSEEYLLSKISGSVARPTSLATVYKFFKENGLEGIYATSDLDGPEALPQLHPSYLLSSLRTVATSGRRKWGGVDFEYLQIVEGYVSKDFVKIVCTHPRYRDIFSILMDSRYTTHLTFPHGVNLALIDKPILNVTAGMSYLKEPPIGAVVSDQVDLVGVQWEDLW